jgi:hypothetical protein
MVKKRMEIVWKLTKPLKLVYRCQIIVQIQNKTNSFTVVMSQQNLVNHGTPRIFVIEKVAEEWYIEVTLGFRPFAWFRPDDSYFRFIAL